MSKPITTGIKAYDDFFKMQQLLAEKAKKNPKIQGNREALLKEIDKLEQHAGVHLTNVQKYALVCATVKYLCEMIDIVFNQ